MDKKEILICCPHCQKRFSYYESQHRPFCCERCRQVDLGMWLTESYKVASNQALTPEEVDELETQLTAIESGNNNEE